MRAGATARMMVDDGAGWSFEDMNAPRRSGRASGPAAPFVYGRAARPTSRVRTHSSASAKSRRRSLCQPSRVGSLRRSLTCRHGKEDIMQSAAKSSRHGDGQARRLTGRFGLIRHAGAGDAAGRLRRHAGGEGRLWRMDIKLKTGTFDLQARQQGQCRRLRDPQCHRDRRRQRLAPPSRPSLITVTIGDITACDSSNPLCTPTSIDAGEGFVDSGDHARILTDLSGAPAETCRPFLETGASRRITPTHATIHF